MLNGKGKLKVKKPRGRPTLGAFARTKKLKISISHFEQLQIKEAAFCANLTVANFVRKAALNQKISKNTIPKVNAETWLVLAKLGGNINQIAYQLNRKMDTAEALSELKSDLKMTHQAVINCKKLLLKNHLSEDGDDSHQ